MSAFCPYDTLQDAYVRLSSIASSITLWSMPCQASSKRFFSSLYVVTAVQLRLMHSLLDVTPYLVIDRIKVGAIQQPQIWRNETGVDC